MQKLQKKIILKILIRERQRMIVSINKDLKQYEYLVTPLAKLQDYNLVCLVDRHYFQCTKDYAIPFNIWRQEI